MGTVRGRDLDYLVRDGEGKLVEVGRNSVRRFVEKEREIIRKSRDRTTYQGYDERLLAYVHLLQTATRSVIFCDISSYWLYLIFPAVFCAARRGIRITYLASADVSDRREEARRSLLRALGVNVC